MPRQRKRERNERILALGDAIKQGAPITWEDIRKIMGFKARSTAFEIYKRESEERALERQDPLSTA